MSWLSKLFFAVLEVIDIASWWVKRQEKKEKAKQEALNEIQEGLDNQDGDKVTAGFDHLNSIK